MERDGVLSPNELYDLLFKSSQDKGDVGLRLSVSQGSLKNRDPFLHSTQPAVLQMSIEISFAVRSIVRFARG